MWAAPFRGNVKGGYCFWSNTVSLLLCYLIMRTTDLLDDFDFGDDPQGEDDRQQHFQPNDEGLVVAKFYDQLEANVSAARLRSEGVPCFITNAFSQSMMPNVQSFVSLHVRQDDIDRAKEILAAHAAEMAAQTPDEQPATTFRLENTLLIVLVVMLVFLALSAYLNF